MAGPNCGEEYEGVRGGGCVVVIVVVMVLS